MEYLNALEARQDVTRKELQTLLLLLAPFAPYITEELWETLGNQGSIHTTRWPTFDPEAIRSDFITLPVQVNGRVRDQLEIASETPEDEVRRQALASEKVQRFLAGQNVTKVIYVPGRVVNVVAG
jgi:leucyl-tRNA synthetase